MLCVMPVNYEAVYQSSRHALGKPSGELVRFFNERDAAALRVLDVGCGQGRDALFIAALGHTVVGVDQSPTGIRDLVADATAEHLTVSGQVANICTFEPAGNFDVVLFDRTLHMLAEADRAAVLARFIRSAANGGYLLIVDEKRNMPQFERVLAASGRSWLNKFRRRGYWFLQLDQ